MKNLFILLFLLSLSLSANDMSGVWSTQNIIDCSWKFIKSQKEEMLVRKKAVFDEINVDVKLKFRLHDNPSEDEKKLHEKFLKGRLPRGRIISHISNLLRELEENRVILAAAELKAEKSWNESEKQAPAKEETAMTEEYLYGTKINSKKLGVILDNSGSMARFLPGLRQEIKRKFQGAEILEVYGSMIQVHEELGKKTDMHWFFMSPTKGENPFQKKWYCQSIPLNTAHYFIVKWERSVLSAMETLAYHKKVDAIYWFTDLKDHKTTGLNELEEMQKKTGVKIYLQTVGRRPTNKLRSIIENSGGSISKKLK